MKAFREPSSSTSTGSSSDFSAPGAESASSNQAALGQLQGQGVETLALDASSFENPGLVTLPPDIFVQILRTAPPSGTVCDLTGGGPVDAGADWVKLDANGPAWIHLSSLSPAHRAALVPALESAGGQFSISADGRLVLGVENSEVFLGADAADAESVLKGANDREQDEDIFDFLNGEESVLFASQADPSSFDAGQTKPGSWYNGYEVKNGKVEPHKSNFDDSDREAPGLDMQGLKDLIKRCLDISGLRKVVGDNKEMFESAMTERFQFTSGLGESAFQGVLDELWSYFQTGAGIDQKVDIGRLQALVRALDPEIQITAETNTPFGGQTFQVGETDLARGDGKFGRATMLSLLHLFGDFEKQVNQPPSVGTVGMGVIDERDHFLIDNSPSMMSPGYGSSTAKWPSVQTAVDGALGSGPGQQVRNRTQGSFNQARARVGGDYVKVDESLVKAWHMLCPNDSREERDAFADLLGVDRKDIFDANGLMPKRLMGLLGDGTNSAGMTATSDFGGKGESPIKAMLFALTHPSSLKGDLQQRVSQGKSDPNKDPVRLNGVIDESFQGLEYLELVRALGDHLGVDLRFIVVPYSGGDYASNPMSKLVFIDAADIQVSDSAQEATVTYEQAGVQKTEKVSLDFPDMAPGRVPDAADTDRYRGSAMNVGGFQNQGGVTR